uniref:Lysosomal acid phosphatase n=1 Tax=Denticeps clupeoides TaxID=299321 RepID=A0AAY4B471_9TELE
MVPSPCALLFWTLHTAVHVCLADRSLKYVTLLYRHGDRSPVRTFPADPHQESAWPQGFGQLTQEGMKQHYELGQALRQRYQGFLSEDYSRYEISVRSTDYDRTLMSALANLAGIYPPNGSQVFDPSLRWQPIPVHTVPQDEERLLSFPLECPRYKVLMDETKQTDVFLNMTNTYKEFLEMVRNRTGLEKSTVESVWSVHDTLFCESRHNMTIPDWADADVMEKLRLLKNFGFNMMFGVYKREEKCRLQGGTLSPVRIWNHMNPAPESKERLKIMVYSAHDTTLVALQTALDVFNGLQPPYASCHMFELHLEDDGSFSVAMFYRNDSTKDPYPLTLPGCSQYCPLQDFMHLTKPVIPEDWKKECQVENSITDKGNRHVIQSHFKYLLLERSPKVRKNRNTVV